MALSDRERLIHYLSTVCAIGVCFNAEPRTYSKYVNAIGEFFRQQRCHSISPEQSADIICEIYDEVHAQGGNEISKIIDDLRAGKTHGCMI